MKHQLTALRLREAMEDIHITQSELAAKAEVTKGSVSQYCNGIYKPGNIVAGRIADVLGVNPVWLMGFDVPKYEEMRDINLNALSKDNFNRLKSYYDFLLAEQENANDG